MALYRRQTGTYTIDYRIGGRRVRETYQTKALALERLHEVMLGRGRHAVASVTITIGQLVDKYVEWLRAQDRSANYLKIFDSIKRTNQPLMQLQIRKLNKAVFDKWVESKRASGVSQSTIITQFRMLHSAIEYAVSRDIIAHNPLHKYKLVAPKRRAPYIPTREELQRFFDALGGRDAHQTVDTKRLVYFALATGARVNEIITLRADAITNNIVTIIGKGGWERKFELPQLPFELPKTGYCFTLGHKPWTHRTAIAKVQAACVAAGLPRMKFHTLRHIHATYECANGTPYRELMLRCGWRSLTILQRYMDLSRTIKPGPYLPQFTPQQRTQFGHTSSESIAQPSEKEHLT